jgi:translation elongation factor EF-1alpha
VILEHKSIICAGYSAVMHIHCAAEEVTVKVSIVLTANITVAFLCTLRKSQNLLFISITLFGHSIIMTVQSLTLISLGRYLNFTTWFMENLTVI